MATNYSFQVDIDNISPLSNGNFNLCVAIGVNNKFDLVWCADMRYKKQNPAKYNFTDHFKVFTTDGFKDNQKPNTLLQSDDIQEGETVVFSGNGFGTPTTKHVSGGPIRVLNQDPSPVYFGLKVRDSSGYSAINVRQSSSTSGLVSMYPTHQPGTMPEVMLWWDQHRETGMMFEHSNMRNAFHFIFQSDSAKITYNVDPDDPAGGIWGFGGVLSAPRTYDCDTNTFKLDEKLLSKPELIKAWNDEVDQGIHWQRQHLE